MRREVVESQIIHSVGYDQHRRVLEVEFRNGWIYEYDDVPETTYRGLMSADSHGKFLHKHIVDSFVTRRTK